MFAIVDLEWMNLSDGRYMPTQLAATRVDEDWSAQDSFQTLFHPMRGVRCDFSRPEFSGAKPYDFLNAPLAGSAFSAFSQWLCPDDVLCVWDEPSQNILRILFRLLMKQGLTQRFVVLQPYFPILAKDDFKCDGNPYQLARARGLDIPLNVHQATSDVEVIRILFSHMQFQQRTFNYTVSQLLQGAAPAQFEAYWDAATNLLHLPDCPDMPPLKQLKGYENLVNCVDHSFTPCPVCCGEIWRNAVHARNAELTEAIGSAYFYFKRSHVFHRASCRMIRNSRRTYYGVTRYFTCIHSGLIPCKLCNPTPTLRFELLDQRKAQAAQSALQHAPMIKKAKSPQSAAPAPHAAALKRHTQAVKARKEIAHKELTTLEHHDAIIRTSSNYTYWAGKGCRTFHLLICPKLKQTSDLRGFSLYADALHAGFKPCRICNPSEKYDMSHTIPLTSRVREKESPDSLLELCSQYAFDAVYDEPFLSVTTPAAQWRFSLQQTPPIYIKHKPGNAKVFHRQHRIFLSYTDVIQYIARHDKQIAKENTVKEV